MPDLVGVGRVVGDDRRVGRGVDQGVTVAAPLSATSFTMQLDVLSGAGDFGQGQGVQALVSQGGSLYQTSLGITGFPFNSFTTLTFSGTFTSAAFTKISGAGPATPSFDGVTPTNFGFAVGNNMSATLTQYYDNWNISFSAPPPQVVPTAVPALSTGSLLSLTLLVALVSIGVWRRRR